MPLKNGWTVLCDEYVTTDSGTMVVHQAPTHGVEDYTVCLRYGLFDKYGNGLPNFVDDDGKFVPH